MKKLFRQLAIVGSACALTAGLATGITAFTASPASAANGPCSDTTNDSKTPVHQLASTSSESLTYFGDNYKVYGTCNYYNNTSESDWFMQIDYSGSGNKGGVAYIWVQRLVKGSQHNCVKNGTTAPINYTEGYCPLRDYTGP